MKTTQDDLLNYLHQCQREGSSGDLPPSLVDQLLKRIEGSVNFAAIRNEFAVIKQMVNDAIQAAWSDKPLRSEAVNWGDLSCVAVELVIGEDYDHFLATIEEADPDARQFMVAILDYLEQHGRDDIRVRLEW